MNPKLWQAIDRIGNRKASRFEWESASGLPWEGLSPYLRPTGGQAEEVSDPDTPSESLAVWQVGDGTALLESEAFPAHRAPLSIECSKLALYRIDATAIGAHLAKVMNFMAQPVKAQGPLLTVGFVQDAGARRTDVVLFIPSVDPRQSTEALRSVTRDKCILLIPTARWAAALPDKLLARELAGFFSTHEEDFLVNVPAPAPANATSGTRQKGPIISVRQEDRWSHVNISLNAEARLLRVQIGDRQGTIHLPTARGKFTKAAEIFARVAAQNPPRWANSDFPEKEREASRKAFQRFCQELRCWIPVNDGQPFREDRSERCHYPKFQCEPLRAGERIA